MSKKLIGKKNRLSGNKNSVARQNLAPKIALSAQRVIV